MQHQCVPAFQKDEEVLPIARKMRDKRTKEHVFRARKGKTQQVRPVSATEVLPSFR